MLGTTTERFQKQESISRLSPKWRYTKENPF